MVRKDPLRGRGGGDSANAGGVDIGNPKPGKSAGIAGNHNSVIASSGEIPEIIDIRPLRERNLEIACSWGNEVRAWRRSTEIGVDIN